MPYVIRPRGVRRAIGALLGAAALISILMPAAARADFDLSCPTEEAPMQPFQQFGDSAEYFLAPNGGLEDGPDGWKLSNASVVTGNEPYFVHSREDTKSLLIERGGKATSPRFCVSSAHPTFRFFVRQPKGARAPDLKVHISYINEKRDAINDVQVDTYAGAGRETWIPSRPIGLWGNLGFLDQTATTTAQLVFEAERRGSGTWQVDDIYVDHRWA
jgi:hypothetical protein